MLIFPYSYPPSIVTNKNSGYESYQTFVSIYGSSLLF